MEAGKESGTTPTTADEVESEEEVKPNPYSREAFYAPDSPSNILLDEGGNLKAATLPKLIAKLTVDADSAMLHDFLLTHRSFTAGGLALLVALKAREATALPEQLRLIRIKIFNLLKIWIEKLWLDFAKDCPQLGDETLIWMKSFMLDPAAGGGSDVPVDKYKDSAKIASGIYEKLSQKMQNPTAGLQRKRLETITGEKELNREKLQMLKDPQVDILACPPAEIAKQLTLIEWKMWSSIKPYEFLDLAWTKKDRATRSGNVLAMIDRFNYVSGWVATQVCFTEKPRDRIKLVAKLISVAYQLKILNNFNGLMAVVSGLNRNPVYRLRATFAEVDKLKDGRYQKMWQEMNTATSSEKAYSNLRKEIRSVTPPCIPYLGMYLTDLTFIEEGNAKNLTEHKLINFHKRRLTAAAIADIQTYQIVGYSYADIPEAQWKLQGEVIVSEDDLYELSNYLEPRAGAYVLQD